MHAPHSYTMHEPMSFYKKLDQKSLGTFEHMSF
jgi:hypothetical protein